MQQHVAFLHTSRVHIETFERLLGVADPSLKIEHVVDESLLIEAQEIGAKNPIVVSRVHQAMARAASNGASLVVCTCSTIGGAAERTETGGKYAAARIDRAMADKAVSLGPRILVVVALESTLAPTTELIEESATARHKEVGIRSLFVQGAWAHFLRGEQSAYVAAIVAAVRDVSYDADVVVLAQASMSPASNALMDLGVEVLSSPSLGVQSIVARVNRCIGHKEKPLEL